MTKDIIPPPNKNRIRLAMVPNDPILCTCLNCIYIENYECDDPRTNKGNSDAQCHNWPNKELINHLYGCN